MGAGHQKDQAMIRNLEFSASSPSAAREEGIQVELMIDHPYVIKPSMKVPIVWGLKSF